MTITNTLGETTGSNDQDTVHRRQFKPGLYVHPSRRKRAIRLFTGPVYVDEMLTPDDWYVVEQRRP